MYTARGLKTWIFKTASSKMRFLSFARCFSTSSGVRTFPLEGRFKDILTPSYIKEKANQLDEEGYTILDEFYSTEMIDELREEMDRIIREAENSQFDSAAIFDTRKQAEYLNKSIDYFLDSASKISFLYENNVFDENGKLKGPLNQCINKVGHAMHDLNPAFHKFAYSNAVKTVAASILKMRNPILVQSMYIFKSPKVGGEVIPHQDHSYLITRPLTCKAFWIAFDDVNVKNGCLWGIPGSHKTTPVTSYWKAKREKIYDKDGKFLRLESTVFYEPEGLPKYEIKNDVPLEAKKGSIVLFDGGFTHYSNHNYSTKSRHAVTLHMVEADAEWDKENWLQRTPDLPFRLHYEEKP